MDLSKALVECRWKCNYGAKDYRSCFDYKDSGIIQKSLMNGFIYLRTDKNLDNLNFEDEMS